MKKVLYILILLHLVLAVDIYKEIKISNDELQDFSFLQSIGINIDHIYQSDDYIQFAINEYDLSKLIIYNINYYDLCINDR